MAILFTLQVFARNLLRESCRSNIFQNSLSCRWMIRVMKLGVMHNKPTYYLLDYWYYMNEVIQWMKYFISLLRQIFSKILLKPSSIDFHLIHQIPIRLISSRADVVWPTRSCDLIPLDYYLFDAVKDKWRNWRFRGQYSWSHLWNTAAHNR